MADVILETRKLTKECKGFSAVSNVDLRVQRGHIHALIGPNGAGKTTCFDLRTKCLTPSAAQIARMGIIRSFRSSAVFPHLTVLQNVRIGLQRGAILAEGSYAEVSNNPQVMEAHMGTAAAPE